MLRALTPEPKYLRTLLTSTLSLRLLVQPTRPGKIIEPNSRFYRRHIQYQQVALIVKVGFKTVLSLLLMMMTQ
jgi:hypothetical protein